MYVYNMAQRFLILLSFSPSAVDCLENILGAFKYYSIIGTIKLFYKNIFFFQLVSEFFIYSNSHNVFVQRILFRSKIREPFS